MIKKITACILAAAICLFAVGCAESGNAADTSTGSHGSEEIAETTYFSDGDYKDVTAEDPNATITLSGSTGAISDSTRGSSGETVTVTSKGIYRVSGTSEGVSIVINDESESGNVYLVLDGVSMTNASSPCIVVEAADKVILQCVGSNTLTYTASSAEYDGAVYAKDDITINGGGALAITSSLHGIVCKDDVKLTGAEITLNTDSIGIKANQSVRVGGGTASVSSGHDGVQVENSSGDGYFYMESGTLKVSSGYDGIDVGTDADSMTGYVLLAGGTLDITAGGGSDKSAGSDSSQKGVKCDGDIQIRDASLSVSSADDALHSAKDITVSGGALTLSSSDDGIHADNALNLTGGEVNITKSYEGLEAYEITISGGDIRVVASDDGVNAAGGSDSSSTETMPSFWGGSSSSSGTLTVSGGNLYVNAAGDGLDSNGSLYISGGTILVEGPTDNGNGALDKGDGSDCVAEITGGVVLAIGSAGMAVNFDSGSQCSGLVSLSGSAGTTITVDDGSGFSFTASKAFSCVVYSSPSMAKGSSYTVTAGSSSATMNFSSGLYYSNVSAMGTGGGGMNNMGPR